MVMEMKKIIFALAALMLLCFVGCGDDASTSGASANAALSQSDANKTFAATVDVRGSWTFSSGGYSYLISFYDDNTVEFVRSNSASEIEAMFHGKWSTSVDEVTVELADSLSEQEFTCVMTAVRADPKLTLTSILGEPLISQFDYGQAMVFTAV